MGDSEHQNPVRKLERPGRAGPGRAAGFATGGPRGGGEEHATRMNHDSDGSRNLRLARKDPSRPAHVCRKGAGGPVGGRAGDEIGRNNSE
jgi:hypothetical protein